MAPGKTSLATRTLAFALIALALSSTLAEKPQAEDGLCVLPRGSCAGRTGEFQGPAPKLEETLWSRQLKSSSQKSTSICAGKICAGSMYEGLLVLDAKTGDLIWELEDGVLGAPLSVDGKTLFVLRWGGNEGKIGESLCAYELETGKEIWSSPFSDGRKERDKRASLIQRTGFSSLVFSEKTLAFGFSKPGSPGCLFGFDAETGKEKWRVKIPESSYRDETPCLIDEAMSAWRGGQKAEAKTIWLDVATGKPVSKFKLPARDGAISNGLLVLGRSQGAICFDLLKGGKKWLFSREDPESSSSYNPLTISKGILCYGSTFVQALNLETGKELWKAPLDKTGKDSYAEVCFAAVAGGVYFCGACVNVDNDPNKKSEKSFTTTYPDTIRALELSSGKELGRIKIHGNEFKEIMIADGVLYALGDDRIFAIK